MNRLLAYLGRFAVMLSGFFCATLAASAFLHLLLAGMAGVTAQEASFLMSGPLLVTVPVAALFIGYFAFVPAVPFVLAAEALEKRDWLYHALSGGGVSLVIVGLRLVTGGEGGRQADPFPALVFVAAGLVGGIAYWLVAGRSSGAWLYGSGDPSGRTPSGS